MGAVSIWRRLTDAGSDTQQAKIREALSRTRLELPEGATTLDKLRRRDGTRMRAHDRSLASSVLAPALESFVYWISQRDADRIRNGEVEPTIAVIGELASQTRATNAIGSLVAVRLLRDGSVPKRSSPNRTRVRSPWRVSPATVELVERLAAHHNVTESEAVRRAVLDGAMTSGVISTHERGRRLLEET